MMEGKNETPIELLRYGPPPFDRLEQLENELIEASERMSDEEIKAELEAAGIDMAPLIEKLRSAIESKRSGYRKC